MLNFILSKMSRPLSVAQPMEAQPQDWTQRRQAQLPGFSGTWEAPPGWRKVYPKRRSADAALASISPPEGILKLRKGQEALGRTREVRVTQPRPGAPAFSCTTFGCLLVCVFSEGG